jgi:hypothetical protein
MIKHQRPLRASPTRRTHERRPLGGALKGGAQRELSPWLLNRRGIPRLANEWSYSNEFAAEPVEGNPGGSPEATRRAFNKLSARSGGGLAATWARGVQAGSARVAGCVFESLRNAGAERDEGRAPGPPRASAPPKGRAMRCTVLGFTSNLAAVLRTLMPPARAARIRSVSLSFTLGPL